MFEIERKQAQYLTYLLWDRSAKSSLEIVPERGGIVTRWQVRDREILYLDSERFANPQLSVRGGIPILFPICGNLPDDTYTDQDQTYTLKQHGFARDLPWQVTDQSTENQASLTLMLESNDRTRAVYPFEFQLVFTYCLKDNILEIHQHYINSGHRTMPFSMGLHPYFLVHEKTQLQFDIPSHEFWDQKHQTAHRFVGQFDFEPSEIDVAFRDLDRQWASVTDGSRKFSLKMEYNPIYSTLVFWTLKGKDYYCLEPWSASRNALNSGDRLLYLHPNSSLKTVVRFAINERSL